MNTRILIAALASAGIGTAWAAEVAPAWQDEDFVMEEVVVTAERPHQLYMEEIVVTAKRSEVDTTVAALPPSAETIGL